MSSTAGNSSIVLRLGRLTPGVVLVTVAALLAAGFLMARVLDAANVRQEVQQALVQARVMASTTVNALSRDDRSRAQNFLDALKANPEIEAGAIYGANGRLFAAYRRSGETPLPATAVPFPPHLVGDRLVIAVPVRSANEVLGTVYIRSVTEPYDARLIRHGLIALLVTMASVVVAVAGLMHLTQRRANEQLWRHAEQLAVANRALEAQIEQREKAEEALRQSQKMEAIGQLTGGVAHDFNNLLQVILGNLERLAYRGLDSRAEAERLIASATRAASRGAVLTQHLLAFARRQPLAPKTLDLNRLIGDMLALVERSLGETIRIETKLSGALWHVSADENQLEHALVNLAVNARDAMPKGGTLRLETTNVCLDEAAAQAQQDARPGEYVQVSVIDSGVGMTPAVMARAFDPFFTTKEIGQGTGLGLSQVYGFVRQSGGHVGIESAPGKGTRVHLYLPRSLEPAEVERVEALSGE